MAVTDYSGLTITQPQTGIQFTKVTDTSADWGLVSNNTYFYDKGSTALFFKDSSGSISGLTSNVSQFVFVDSKNKLPLPVVGVITLAANYTYFFTTTVDLTGDRLVCGQNTTILGGSSENCRIKSTGLIGTALITSTASLPMRNITIEANVALNLNAATPATDALDWFGVNFTDCATVGTIANYSNVIFQDSAFLNSGNLTFDGTVATIGATQCLFNCNALGTVFILAPTLTISRRFRVVYSSFVVLAGEKGIDTTPAPSIPDDGFILNYCNFSGGGTYLDGFNYTSIKSLFINNVGVINTSNVGHNYMINNNIDTVIGIPNVNVWVKAAGTTTLGTGNSPKWTQPVTNRLLYGGIITSDFIYNAVGTVQSPQSNQVISIIIAKNGIIQVESEISVRTGTQNQPFPFSLQDVIQVTTGDYFEIFVLNTQSANVQVADLNVIIQKITG